MHILGCPQDQQLQDCCYKQQERQTARERRLLGDSAARAGVGLLGPRWHPAVPRGLQYSPSSRAGFNKGGPGLGGPPLRCHKPLGSRGGPCPEGHLDAGGPVQQLVCSQEG